MIDFRLYLITDRKLLGKGRLESVVDEACRAGVRAIQLRDKDLDSLSLYETAKEIRTVTTKHRAKLLINDRVDIAIALHLDGVHCPDEGFHPGTAARLLGETAIIGVSTHSLSRALEAEKDGADFITFGPVFHTPSKARYGRPQGTAALREVASAVRIPVLAIGGITPRNAASCLENGATGIAVISALIESTDIPRTVSEFESALGSL